MPAALTLAIQSRVTAKLKLRFGRLLWSAKNGCRQPGVAAEARSPTVPILD